MVLGLLVSVRVTTAGVASPGLSVTGEAGYGQPPLGRERRRCRGYGRESVTWMVMLSALVTPEALVFTTALRWTVPNEPDVLE